MTAHYSTWMFKTVVMSISEGLFAMSKHLAKVEVEEKVSLAPIFLGAINKGIRNHLNKKLMSYSSELGGVFVKYSKPVIQQSTASIYHEYPHVHFTVKYTADVFKPSKGSLVTATIKRVGVKYVTAIIGGQFTIIMAMEFDDERKVAYYKELQEGNDVDVRIVQTPESEDVITSFVGEFVIPGTEGRKRTREETTDRPAKKRKKEKKSTKRKHKDGLDEHKEKKGKKTKHKQKHV